MRYRSAEPSHAHSKVLLLLENVLAYLDDVMYALQGYKYPNG